MAKSLPIAYMDDRKKRALEIQSYPEYDRTMYVYDRETEKYFHDTYSKYTPSNLWDEVMEEVHNPVERDPLWIETADEPKVRIPKVASGCCDRADQY